MNSEKSKINCPFCKKPTSPYGIIYKLPMLDVLTGEASNKDKDEIILILCDNIDCKAFLGAYKQIKK